MDTPVVCMVIIIVRTYAQYVQYVRTYDCLLCGVVLSKTFWKTFFRISGLNKTGRTGLVRTLLISEVLKINISKSFLYVQLVPLPRQPARPQNY